MKIVVVNRGTQPGELQFDFFDHVGTHKGSYQAPGCPVVKQYVALGHHYVGSDDNNHVKAINVELAEHLVRLHVRKWEFKYEGRATSHDLDVWVNNTLRKVSV